MTVADDIAYLRSLDSKTLHTASIYRLRQVADRLESAHNLLQEVHLSWPAHQQVRAWLEGEPRD